MTRENIINELVKMGFNAEATETIKNGVECRGIVFKTGGAISPVIYTDDIIKAAEEAGKGPEDVAGDLVKIYEEHNEPAINIKEIMTADFFKDHLMIGLQRAGREDLIKRPSDFAKIEEYLYVQISPEASFKVNNTILDTVGIDAAEAWPLALANTCKSSKILSMCEALAALGASPDETECPLWIVTNENGIKGAAGILNRPMLESFAKSHNAKKLYIIPSSIHECLIMPFSDNYEPDELTKMIIDINAAQVAPVDQLGDRPYIIDVA